MILFLAVAGFLEALLLIWGLNWLSLIPWRRSLGTHWTERARKLYPAQTAAKLNVWLIPANTVLLQVLLFPEAKGSWLALAFCAWCGAALGTYLLSREVFPRLQFRPWLRYVGATWLLFFGMWTVYICAAFLMPRQFDWRALVIGLGALAAHFFFQFGAWMWVARQLRLLRPPPQRLQRIASEVSERMGIRFRAVWLLDAPFSYAAALPATRELIFSERLLDLLPDNEVAAICAHEMGHVSEPRLVVLRRFLLSLWFFPLLFFSTAAHTGSGLGIFYILVLVLLLLFLRRPLERNMERRADLVAAENQSENGVYARALEKLYSDNLVPAVMPGNNKPHPHLYDRLLSAGVTPEYARPAPPDSLAWPAGAMLASLGLLAVLFLSRQLAIPIGR